MFKNVDELLFMIWVYGGCGAHWNITDGRCIRVHKNDPAYYYATEPNGKYASYFSKARNKIRSPDNLINRTINVLNIILKILDKDFY